MESTERLPPPVGCTFGPYVLDFVRRLAWRDGKPLVLTGKSFEILALLIANRDRVVTKDELLKELWPDTFVQENNVVRHISTMRRALGQRPEQHDYVLTVQGRGYRFVAAVTELRELPPGLAPHASLALHESDDSAVAGPLDEVPSEESVLVQPTPRGRWWPAAIAVGVMAGITVALWAVTRSPQPHEGSRVLRRFTYGPASSLGASWSRDGQTLAFASDRDGNFDIFVQRVDQTDPTRLTSSPSIEWQPAWSPDGQWLAFRSERDGGGIYILPAAGGPERRVATYGFEPRWSPDSAYLLITTSPYRRPRPFPHVVGIDGSVPRPALGDLPADLQGAAFGWHPDGRLSISGMRDGKWLFITASVDGSNAITSSEPTDLATAREAQDLEFGRFVWAPNGRHVYFEGLSHGVRNLWRADIDPQNLAWQGRFERLTTGQGIDRAVAVSPDGHHLAFETSGERTRIWSFPLSPDGQVAGDGVAVTPGAAGEFDAAVSRDGLQLVYRTMRDGRQELWQHSIADGHERRLLADSGAIRSSPRWSPDGASLVYLLSARRSPTEPAQASLAILSTSDGGERLLKPFESHELVPDDWSADGQSVLGACRSSDPNRSGLCVMNIAAGTVRMLASGPPFGLNNARFSPNQRWISFTNTDSTVGRSTVYVRSVDGGPMTAVTDGQAFEDKAHWDPDGDALYFVSNRGGFLNVWGRRVNPDSGKPVGSLFQVTRFDGLRQSFAPDLRDVDLAVTKARLFVPVTEISTQIWVLENVAR